LEIYFKWNLKAVSRQGEVCVVHLNQDTALKAEVIEIVGNVAKVQVFEDTKGIRLGSEVTFETHLLEAELGPGLLTSIIDGLQNPLESIAAATGLFLARGVYIPALDRKKHWDYISVAKIGDVLTRGDALGTTMEGRFHHTVMLPFSIFSDVTITWVAKNGSYTVDTVIAKGKDTSGKEYEFTMIQKWPVKIPLFEGEKLRPQR
jgi:V/A-type H+-transporting ATPase subunit A